MSSELVTELELLPSSFKFHNFTCRVGEVRANCRIIRMEHSAYIWIGDAEDAKMNDLTVAMISRYEKSPIATKIMGTNEDAVSSSLSKRLAKKCGKPVYVSFNVAVNRITLPGIEKAIQDELNTHKDILAF